MKKTNDNKKTKKNRQFDLNHISTAIDDHFYRLDGHEPVRCTLAEYARFMQDESKRVLVQTQVGDLRISTIFTGIDQNFGRGDPALFETVVFGLPDDLHPRWLHSAWDEAMEHHGRLADAVRRKGPGHLLDEIEDMAMAKGKP